MTTTSFDAARAGIIAVGRRLDARGWAPATAGNYSVRLDDGFALTASGWHKGRLSEEGVLRLDADGHVVGSGRPSAETHLHLSIYRQFPAAGAVLHGHSPQAVGLTRSTSSPNSGRSRVPSTLPINAATSQSHPCRLPDTMPLKYAPILQPYASRAP